MPHQRSPTRNITLTSIVQLLSQVYNTLMCCVLIETAPECHEAWTSWAKWTWRARCSDQIGAVSNACALETGLCAFDMLCVEGLSVCIHWDIFYSFVTPFLQMCVIVPQTVSLVSLGHIWGSAARDSARDWVHDPIYAYRPTCYWWLSVAIIPPTLQ